jgi:hypothetical protein
MIDWLLAPIDATRPHVIANSVAWHGRMMVLAWCALLPIGILAARFFKITPRQDWPRQLDNKMWWYAHNILQYSGAILVFAAALYVERSTAVLSSYHAVLGWSVVSLTIAQVFGGLLRGSKGGPTAPARNGSLRGDHYDMTLRRSVFERIHKSVGYLAVVLAIAAMATGLHHANAPRWMWFAVAAWWLLLTVAGVRWQRQGRAVDTYQAIWGPDPSHPGNRRTPIGWGIRRRDTGQSE